MFDRDELVQVFDLKRSKISVHNLMASCPLGTHEDVHPSFGIDLVTGKWNCYSCKEKGSTIRTLAHKLRILLSHSMMMESLMVVPDREINRKVKVYDPKKEGLTVTDVMPSYMKKRKISKGALKRFKVSAKGSTIRFPCVLPDGKLYGWIERNDNWVGRYGFQPNGVSRKHLLFGLDREIHRCYLVESMTDMLTLVTWHYEAVSTCGNMIFGEQAKILCSHCDEIILVPQNDGSARKWIRDAEKNLKSKVRVFGVAIDVAYKDIGSEYYSKEKWQKDLREKRFLY